jgi:hypothetical protein
MGFVSVLVRDEASPLRQSMSATAAEELGTSGANGHHGSALNHTQSFGPYGPHAPHTALLQPLLGHATPPSLRRDAGAGADRLESHV